MLVISPCDLLQHSDNMPTVLVLAMVTCVSNGLLSHENNNNNHEVLYIRKKDDYLFESYNNSFKRKFSLILNKERIQKGSPRFYHEHKQNLKEKENEDKRLG